MSFDYTTLITDRAQGGVDTLRTLIGKPASQWTEAETAAFRAATMRGAYNYTDLNRVDACLEDLAGRFRRAGYALSGYERIRVERAAGARLPDGYTEIEYIESSGTQYVDTGIIPGTNTHVIMDFKLNAAGTGNRCLFGADGQFSFRWFGSSSVFRSNGGNNVDFPSGIDETARHTVYKTATSTSIDGAYTVTTTVGTVTPTLYLSAQHKNDGGTSNYASANIYSCQLYDDGELVRDYIPCIDPSGAVGLYDLVGGQFYGNAGTGTFTAGPEVTSDSDVPDGDERDPYTWYVDDVPTAGQMARYLQNVAAVRDEVAALASTPDTPESMALLNYVRANHIEAILLAVDDTLTRMTQSYFYTAEIFAGEV